MVTRLPGNHRVTVGADRSYDTADLIDELRCRNATPHVAQNTWNRRTAIDGRTTRHPGYTAVGFPIRDDLCQWPKEQHVFARRYFHPLRYQTPACRHYLPADLAQAEGLAANVACLPMHTELAEEDMKKYMQNCRKRRLNRKKFMLAAAATFT